MDYNITVIPSSIAIADITDDGKADIIMANPSTNNISVIRNRMVSPKEICPLGSITIGSAVSGSSYKRQISADSVNFTNLNNNSIFISTTSYYLQMQNLPSSYYGYQLRCLVDGNKFGDVYLLRFSNSWTGATSTEWEVTTNWSCGKLPDANTDGVINSGTVTINSNVTVRTLTVKTGANLIVSPGSILTVIK
jgi:hypothetical protein